MDTDTNNFHNIPALSNCEDVKDVQQLKFLMANAAHDLKTVKIKFIVE